MCVLRVLMNDGKTCVAHTLPYTSGVRTKRDDDEVDVVGTLTTEATATATTVATMTSTTRCRLHSICDAGNLFGLRTSAVPHTNTNKRSQDPPAPMLESTWAQWFLHHPLICAQHYTLTQQHVVVNAHARLSASSRVHDEQRARSDPTTRDEDEAAAYCSAKHLLLLLATAATK